MIELSEDDLAEIDRLASSANAQKAAVRQAMLYGMGIALERAAKVCETMPPDALARDGAAAIRALLDKP